MTEDIDDTDCAPVIDTEKYDDDSDGLAMPLLDIDARQDNESEVPMLPERTIASARISSSGRHPHDATRYEIILFFFCGLGSSLCYIATLSSLVYFKAQYGNESYIYLNLAIYLPLLPVSLAQVLYDQDVDRLVGSFNAYLCRGVVGFIASIVCVAAIPLKGSLLWICANSFLIGVAGAVLQGILYQMAAFCSSSSSSSGYLKASIAAGIQASAFVSLMVSLLTGFGSSDSDTQDGLRGFNNIICLLESMILGLFLILMCQSRPVELSMMRRDSSISLANQQSFEDNGDNNALLAESIHGDEIRGQGPSSQPIELSYAQLWRHTSSVCTSLFLTLVPSFLVASWFTKVKTNLVILPQLLFYCRIVSDFLSRLFTVYKSPSSEHELMFLSGCRLILVAMFFVNASSYIFPHRDALSLSLVSAIAFGSGYLVTGCYQLAPSQLPVEFRDRNATKQAALLNLAFSASALVGLLSSLGLAGLGL